MTEPRRFHLQRHHDVTGASGTGRVADGVLWLDGTATLRWRGDRASTVNWDRIEDAEAIHGHGGHTVIVWDDLEAESAPDPLSVLGQIETEPGYELVPGCEHCPDGHTPPDHGQPWAAYLVPAEGEAGKPTAIHVARSAAAHVAESDAQWVRDVLNGDIR
jgi:hypothetical protein